MPVAPASEVPYPTRTTGTRTQLNAAQRTMSVTVSCAAGGLAAGFLVAGFLVAGVPEGGRCAVEGRAGTVGSLGGPWAGSGYPGSTRGPVSGHGGFSGGSPKARP